MSHTKRPAAIKTNSHTATEAQIFATLKDSKSPNGALQGRDNESLYSLLPKEILDEYKSGEFIGHELATVLEHDSQSKEMTVKRADKKNLPRGLVTYSVLSHANNRATMAFRGTKCKSSFRRDLERHAPGNRTFWQINTLNCLKNLASDLLLAAIKNKQELESKNVADNENLTLNVDGHSLGAADGQNFVVYLLQLIHKGEKPFANITAINFHGMNAPGISKEKCAEAMKLLKAINQLRVAQGHKRLKIRCFWIHAAKDPIQAAGEMNIFAGANPEDVEHHFLYVKHKSKRNGLNKAKDAHTKRLFRPDTDIAYWSYMNNKDPMMGDLIYRRLANKSRFLQSSVVVRAKATMHAATKLIASNGQPELYIPPSPPVEDKEEAAARDRVEKLILNTLYWETKTHYNFKFKVPAGILAMQVDNNKRMKSEGAFATYQAIAVAKKPDQKSCFTYLSSVFFKYPNGGRDPVTDRFYLAFKQTSTFKELVEDAGFIAAEQEVHSMSEVKYKM